MKLLERDDGKKLVRLRVDSIDDLWFIDKLLTVGTVVGTETQRRMEAKPDKLRPERLERIHIFLRLAIEGTEFQDFSNQLRVKGTIVDGPLGVEGYHTLAIGPGSILELEPPELGPMELSLIQEAERSSSLPKALAVYVDDRSEQLFRIHDYGIEDLGSSAGVSGGKMYDGSSLNGPTRFDEITEMIRNNLQKEAPLLLLGPGFFKESLGAHLRNVMGISPQQMIIVPSSSSGRNAVMEVLAGSKGVKGLIGSMRLSRELELLDELMEQVSKGGKATYGRSEVLKALENGAVDHLLLSESNFKREREGPIFELCSRSGANCSIISSRHEKGRMFFQMGGIGALLRYRPDRI